MTSNNKTNPNDTIKNLTRTHKRENLSYEPEHKRLNKEVIPYDANRSVGFNGAHYDEQGNEADVPDGPIIDNNDIVQTEYPSAFYHKEKPDDIRVHSTGLDNKVLNNSAHIVMSNEDYEKMLAASKQPTHQIPADIRKPKSKTSPDVGQYILMVRNKIVLTGPKELVEKKVSDLLYDLDKEFQGIVETDLVVLKRVPVSIGIFIDER